MSRLHHVGVVTTDLVRSLTFYQDVLGLQQIARPPFPIAGAWLALGATEIHLITNPAGTYRHARVVDAEEAHFAIQVSDFDQALSNLQAHGFAEDAAVDSPRRIIVRRNSLAGYPQVYLLDPDGHVVELNAAV